MNYEWVKAFHVMAVISWMAALFYLPRLMVYHCDAPVGSQQSETFKVMERRLLKAISTPAMIATWIAGLYLMWEGGWLRSGWMHGKLLAVVLLSAFHGMTARWVREFAADKRLRTSRFYRIANEVPTVLMIAIVILVVVKPF